MKSSPQRAFTLIELLVVIAIIAILAAILFPVFAQAKNAAKKTASLSNAKNQGSGIQIYLSDSDDVIPFSEAGCGDDGSDTQIQWYATVLPYIKNGDASKNSRGETVAYGNGGIFRDPSHPDAVQGQQYGGNRDLMPSNYCPKLYNGGKVTPSVSATSVDAPADKVLIMNKNRNNQSWSYPYFSAYEWMWTNLFQKDAGGNVTADGSAIMSGLAPRDNGFFMNHDCVNGERTPQIGEECGASAAFRYNGQAIAAYLDSHAKSVAKGRLRWFQNVGVNNGQYPWDQSWYPYNIQP